MKNLIYRVVLLGFSAALLAGNASVANNKVPSRSSTTLASTKTEEFISRGTEPFWNVTVSKNGIVYSSPDAKKQTFPDVAPIKAAGRPADLVRVYPLKGRTNSMLIIKKVSVCSDGMSEKQYPYSATFILGNTVLEGCAEKK
ncbi:MAG: COG3650 family protein [Heteroscytonema crispum UTEX LB 1556]